MRVIRSPENSNISQCFSRNVCMCVCVCGNSSVVSDSLGPQWTVAPRLLCPWNSLSENTGVGCYALLQGIFPTQGSNPGILHYRQILYHLSHRGSHKERIRISTSIHQKQRPHFFFNYSQSSFNCYLLSQWPFISNDFLQCNNLRASQSLNKFSLHV